MKQSFGTGAPAARTPTTCMGDLLDDVANRDTGAGSALNGLTLGEKRAQAVDPIRPRATGGATWPLTLGEIDPRDGGTCHSPATLRQLPDRSSEERGAIVTRERPRVRRRCRKWWIPDPDATLERLAERLADADVATEPPRLRVLAAA